MILLQTAFFAWIWNSTSSIHKADMIDKADLIVVFPGAQDRIIKGHALAKAGYADNLLIIGQTTVSYPTLMQRFGGLPAVNLIANSRSRSTFEDVNIAQQIIREKRFQSVVLVTSTYHMPRVLFLFKTFFWATGIKVDLRYYPVELRDEYKKNRLYFNEMVKFWGSTSEMIGYLVTDTLLRNFPFFDKVGQFIKNRLLFQV